ncbi:hypothetical protein ASD81_16060 [Nocardioides sp. Root614]|nr:hypothetical protein ASD81_16060 [Nocardioides sp. Root614]KRA87631.1 hypothetical protein ASD84_16335 [Nocardioides sp. Root682]
MEKFFLLMGGSAIGFAGTLIGTQSAFLLTGLIGMMLSMRFVSKCILLAGDQPVTALTLSYVIGEMERVAGAQVDQALVASIENRAADLLQTIEHERANLEQATELELAERERLSTVMQGLGNNASLLEAEFKSLPWQALPAIAFVASMKHLAYALSFALSNNGAYRRNLGSVVLPAEREETIDLMAEKEADLVRFARNDLTLERESSTKTSAGLVPTTWFKITAGATQGDKWAYRLAWTCERRWRPNQQCTNFESRRSEFFTSALNKHQALRARVAEALTPEYLAFRNELTMYRGAQFFLVNNRVDDNTKLKAGQSKCLDAPGETSPAPGSGLPLRACEISQGNASGPPQTDQLWRFIRGTGQVENVRQGLCLDVAGVPTAQTDGSRVILASCGDGDAAEHADQQWGMHPFGHLVNLATGRCVDLNGTGGTQSDASAVVSSCEYELGAGIVNAQGWLARGASVGTKASDPTTDQSWTLRYRGESLPTLLPAEVVDALPIARDDSMTLAEDGGPATIDVLANDLDPDGRPREVVSVTQPEHGNVSIPASRATVWYQPESGFCNDPEGTPDRFSYTLNGGSTAMVSVTVTCAEEADTAPPLVAITDFGQNPNATSAVGVFTVDEIGTTVECAVDGGAFAPCASPHKTSSLSTGPHKFVVRATDDAGNVGSAEATATINADAPATRIESGPVGTVTDRDPARFTFTGSRPGATFECMLDTGSYSLCASPTDFGRLSVGTHTFRVRATGSNGITDAIGATRTWTVRRCLIPLAGTGCLV